MPLVPQYIKDLKNHVSGKTIEEVKQEYGLEKIIKLASNESPLGPSPRALTAIRKSLKFNHRYPDAFGFNLRTRLADRFKVKLENVVLGAGSEGIMSTIMRTFLLQEDEIISAANSFIGFKVLANASGCKTHWIPMVDHRYDLEKIADKINKHTKIIYIANPDNPMGTYVTRIEFERFYEKVPERILIILDEAYYEFAQDLDDYPDSMDFRYDNVITLRTFSKAYGLAGVRVGYGFAHETLIENLMKVKAPFEPSFPGHIAGYTALDDQKYLSKTIKIIKKGMMDYERFFQENNINFIRSAANFVTTQWQSKERAQFITTALLKKGIIVRYLGPFGWPEYIRISIGLDYENQACMNAIKTTLV